MGDGALRLVGRAFGAWRGASLCVGRGNVILKKIEADPSGTAPIW